MYILYVYLSILYVSLYVLALHVHMYIRCDDGNLEEEAEIEEFDSESDCLTNPKRGNQKPRKQ